MTTIIDTNELKAARATNLMEIEKETRLMAKRASKPADRQALAEIEETISRIRREWEDKGLVAIAA